MLIWECHPHLSYVCGSKSINIDHAICKNLKNKECIIVIKYLYPPLKTQQTTANAGHNFLAKKSIKHKMGCRHQFAE